MIGLTHESIQKLIGRPIDETYLVIAKNHVLGLDEGAIAGILGCTEDEVKGLMETQDYKDVRLLVGSEYARIQSQKDLSWDSIEAQALENLALRVPLERDTDTLLKIAAIANKAQRRQTRNGTQVLDPTGAQTRVPLTLTRRYTEVLNGNGQVAQRSETQQISITDAQNPQFSDIDRLLGVRERPPIPKRISYTTHEPDATLDDLSDVFEGKGI